MKEAPAGYWQRALAAVGALSLFVLMVVVFVDVVGRNLFNKPLPWGTELLEVVVALMIFVFYPLLALRSNHITVDLIGVGPVLQRVQRTLACGVGAVLFAVIAFCTGKQAVRSAGYGDASPLLHIPTAMVLWAMSILAGVTVVAFVIALVRAGQGRAAPAHPVVE